LLSKLLLDKNATLKSSIFHPYHYLFVRYNLKSLLT
jgi:hypothetical protein